MTGISPEMERGRFASPVRKGLEVHRRSPQSAGYVQALLGHFEARGVAVTPRFLGTTADGQQRVSYIEGRSGYPPYDETLRSDDCLRSVGRAIRTLHDASAGFLSDDPWSVNETSVAARVECVGHHDLAPWNFVFRGSEVAGVIDWDTAAPSGRAWDLSYAAFHFVPFHADDALAAWGWDTVPDRVARLNTLLEAYGEGVEVAEVLDAMVQRVHGMGSFIDECVRKSDPRFRVHALEGHGAGFRRAALTILDLRHRYFSV